VKLAVARPEVGVVVTLGLPTEIRVNASAVTDPVAIRAARRKGTADLRARNFRASLPMARF
jgi:hypothetical protein